jgi:flagellar FliJ protein
MKKFEFTLNSLLMIKNSLERQAKQKMAEAVSRRDKCQEEIEEIERRKELARTNNKSFTAHEYLMFSRYYSDLERMRKSKTCELEAIEKEIEEIRQELVTIMQERKVLEKLREKQYEEYLVELGKEQDKLVDDMMTYKITIA